MRFKKIILLSFFLSSFILNQKYSWAVWWKLSPDGGLYPKEYETDIRKKDKKDIDIEVVQKRHALQDKKKEFEDTNKKFLDLKDKYTPEDLTNLLKAQNEYIEAQQHVSAFEAVIYEKENVSRSTVDSKKDRMMGIEIKEDEFWSKPLDKIDESEALSKLKMYRKNLEDLEFYSKENEHKSQKEFYRFHVNQLAAQRHLLKSEFKSGDKIDGKFELLKSYEIFHPLSPVIYDHKSHDTETDSEKKSDVYVRPGKSSAVSSSVKAKSPYSPEFGKKMARFDKLESRLNEEYERLNSEVLDLKKSKEKGLEKEWKQLELKSKQVRQEIEEMYIEKMRLAKSPTSEISNRWRVKLGLPSIHSDTDEEILDSHSEPLTLPLATEKIEAIKKAMVHFEYNVSGSSINHDYLEKIIKSCVSAKTLKECKYFKFFWTGNEHVIKLDTEKGDAKHLKELKGYAKHILEGIMLGPDKIGHKSYLPTIASSTSTSTAPSDVSTGGTSPSHSPVSTSSK